MLDLCINMPKLGTVLLTSALFIATAVPAVGGALTLSYTGNFTLDNDVVLVPFTVLDTSNILLQSFSYGGGNNGNGDVIARGGFEPALQIFTRPGGTPGGSVQIGFDGNPCGFRRADALRLGFCADVFVRAVLDPGD